MDRTWLCSVLFMDIVDYSSQSVESQMKWKTRFNGYLAEAIQDTPKDERVILDTGDGAAVCFLGSPEPAMFAALHLSQSFTKDAREQPQGLRVRIGVNLGPVKLVKDINGSLNAIGDGINAGQRVMSFAQANQILVSQSFFEVVSRLSDDYKALFKLRGVETDKHVREHTVYSLLPPGSDAPTPPPSIADGVAIPVGNSKSTPVSVSTPPAVALPTPAAAAPPSPQKRSMAPILIGAVVVVVLAAGAALAWRFAGSGGSRSDRPAATNSAATSTPAHPTQNTPAPAQNIPAPAPQQVATNTPPPSPAVTSPSTVTQPAATTPAQPPPAPPAKEKAIVKETAPAPKPEKTKVAANPPPNAATPSSTPAKTNAVPAPVTDAKVAAFYDDGMRLIDQQKPAEALPQFDQAIRANANDVYSYLGRARAHRMMNQFDMSMQDCNAAIRLRPQDPQVFFCRGLTQMMTKQFDQAVRDYSEAIRLNPSFVLAYDGRGNAYINLQQWDRALQDFTQALQLKPSNAQAHLRRALVYENLQQYSKAIQDYDQAIQIEPGNARAYNLRANAKSMSGDGRGAAADRNYAKQLKQ